VVVELVGLPGVGKSFLCRSLEDVYASTDGVRVIVESETTAIGILVAKLWRAMRFATMHASITLKLVRTLRTRCPILHGGRLSKLVNLLSEADRSVCAGPLETMISEQGVLQAIWSLEMRSDESVHAELLAVLKRWLPDHVVFVRVERQEHETRLRRRENGKSQFDRLAPDRLPEAIECGLRRTDEILDVWASRVHGAERLDFHNDRGARVGDIVGWVDRLRVPAPCVASRVRSDGVG